MKFHIWIRISLVTCFLLVTHSCSAMSPAVRRRDKLDYEDLMSGTVQLNKPIDNAYLVAVGETEPALSGFEGSLTISANSLEIKSYVGDYYPVGFPAVTVSFFTHGEYLVPVERNIIKGRYGEWGVIVDPGKVWSEPADKGMSRASFPFILLRPDPNYPRCHNGVATFMYDEKQVSSLYIQVVQETNPDLIFDMWGFVNGAYAPGVVEDKDKGEAQFILELERQIEIRQWDELEKQYGAKLTRQFNRDIKKDTVSAAGLVIDNAVYVQPMMTRYGAYPFPRYMRSHVYSVSKSMGNGIAMLRLAEKYGDHVFDLRIADYLDITAKHNGWENVTFGDTLNMAVGVGNGSHERYPPDIYADGDDSAFWNAGTIEQKLKVIFSSDNHPWEPGQVTRYINAHAFVLSAAMDAYLKSQEGPDVNLWDFVTEEVFEPIGVYHLPMLHTIERNNNPGTPMMVLGLYPTVDDIGKIAMLLQNDGKYGGTQLLRVEKLDEALNRSDAYGLPTGTKFDNGDQFYHMSFWGYPYKSQDQQYYQIPYMTGYGGSTVVLSPNSISSFRFTDGKAYDFEPLIQVTETIRQFPDGRDQPFLIASETPE